MRRPSSNFGDHQRSIIRKRSTISKRVDIAQDQVGKLRGLNLMVRLDQLAQLLGAVKLPLGIGGFRDAVGVNTRMLPGSRTPFHSS